MLEWIAPSFIYSVAKDLFGYLRRNRRRLSQSEVLALRQRWKQQFERHVSETYRRELRRDVIIRDVKRLDVYPDLDAHEKGILPWFRLDLVGTYHRGILVAHGWGTLTQHGADWRFTNYASGEKGDLNVLMISSIPYENIDNVDWDGDEHYSFPHVYCFLGAPRSGARDTR